MVLREALVLGRSGSRSGWAARSLLSRTLTMLLFR